MKFIPNYTFIYSSYSYNVWRCPWQRKLTNTGFFFFIHIKPIHYPQLPLTFFPFLFSSIYWCWWFVYVFCVHLFLFTFFPPLYLFFREKKGTKNGKKSEIILVNGVLYDKHLLYIYLFTQKKIYSWNVHKTNGKMEENIMKRTKAWIYY